MPLTPCFPALQLPHFVIKLGPGLLTSILSWHPGAHAESGKGPRKSPRWDFPRYKPIKNALRLAPIHLDVASVVVTFTLCDFPQVKTCAAVSLTKTCIESHVIRKDLACNLQNSHPLEHRAKGMAEAPHATHLCDGLSVIISNTAGGQQAERLTSLSPKTELVRLSFIDEVELVG